ncbi:MAG: hypothetical protein FWG65_07560 [Turicibacter sp.]|nr:hypothetical protein [Turicibacter sp.]
MIINTIGLFQLIFLSLRIRFANAANRVLYLLRRLPGLKRLISSEMHDYEGVKIAALILGFSFVVSKKIGFFLLYLGLLYSFGLLLSFLGLFDSLFDVFGDSEPRALFSGADIVGNMLVAWFVISFIGAPVNAVIVGAEHWRNDETMVVFFRTNPIKYGKSRILADRVSDWFIIAPALFIGFVILLDGVFVAFWAVFATLTVYTAFRLFAEFLNLSLFLRKGIHFATSAWGSFGLLIFFVLLGLVVPYFLGVPDFNALFLSPYANLAVIASVLAIFLLIKYLGQYPLYFDILVENIHRNKGWAEEYKKATASWDSDHESAKDWSAGVDSTNLTNDKHSHRSGFDYLNVLFFERHRKLFFRKMLLRCALPILLSLGVLLFTAFAALFLNRTPREIFFSEYSNLADLFDFTSVFLFITYLASMGKIVTGAIFVNCDIHMLHYPYYRQAGVILASFKARFAKLAKFNLLITSILAFSTIGSLWLLWGYMVLEYAIVFLATLTIIGLILAFNDLFLYYVIQPYDSDGRGKSWLYSVINWIVYALTILFTGMPIEPLSFAIAWLVAGIIYSGFGTIILLKIAPRRFRLR